MPDFKMKDLKLMLHIALSRAVMSGIRVSAKEADAFQAVHNVLSRLESWEMIEEGEEE